MPPLPSRASIWYWPSRTLPTKVFGSSSRTSPSLGQKLRLSSNLLLQLGQNFMRAVVYNESVRSPAVRGGGDCGKPSVRDAVSDSWPPPWSGFWHPLFSINLFRVFSHHSIGIERRNQSPNRSFHQREPAKRQIIVLAIIEGWNHFLFQYTIHRSRVFPIRHFLADFTQVADGESVRAVKTFQPPAVQHGKIQHTIHRCFLTARTDSP